MGEEGAKDSVKGLEEARRGGKKRGMKPTATEGTSSIGSEG